MRNINKKIKELELSRSKEENKCLGKCECCGMSTVLVEDIGMCGPCTFGEADTINGNW